MFLPLCPFPPSQLSTSRHWFRSRETLLAALPGMPGYVTVQSPSQKSNCRLAEFAEHGSESTAAKAELPARGSHTPATKSNRTLLHHLELRTSISGRMTEFLLSANRRQ